MKRFNINRLKIASPCPVSWNEMTGDNRTRHCSLCELNVHNVAGMTHDEVARLVGESSGRLCMRLVRRADGTVMTKDCPVGLRAYGKRIASLAGASLATILGLFSISYGQEAGAETMVDGSKIKVMRSVDCTGRTNLQGTVVDPDGAVIPHMTVFIENKDGGIQRTTSDDDGHFAFEDLQAGIYAIRLSAANGFRKMIVTDFELLPKQTHEITLVREALGELVGVLALDSELPLFTTPDKVSVTSPLPRRP